MKAATGTTSLSKKATTWRYALARSRLPVMRPSGRSCRTRSTTALAASGIFCASAFPATDCAADVLAIGTHRGTEPLARLPPLPCRDQVRSLGALEQAPGNPIWYPLPRRMQAPSACAWNVFSAEETTALHARASELGVSMNSFPFWGLASATETGIDRSCGAAQWIIPVNLRGSLLRSRAIPRTMPRGSSPSRAPARRPPRFTAQFTASSRTGRTASGTPCGSRIVGTRTGARIARALDPKSRDAVTSVRSPTSERGRRGTLMCRTTDRAGSSRRRRVCPVLFAAGAVIVAWALGDHAAASPALGERARGSAFVARRMARRAALVRGDRVGVEQRWGIRRHSSSPGARSGSNKLV